MEEEKQKQLSILYEFCLDLIKMNTHVKATIPELCPHISLQETQPYIINCKYRQLFKELSINKRNEAFLLAPDRKIHP